MNATDALRQQRQRGVILRERLRRLGDRAYDTDAALLTRWNQFFPRFSGHTAGQQSLEYAILLLHSDDRTYGTDDAGEANRIIRRILAQQDLRPGSPTYGNFFWMTHWDRVKDANAVSFLCSGLVYAYLTFPNKLQHETKAALERSFPETLKGIRGHKVRWQYTNIFFLNLGGLVSLARVLGDPAIHAEAVADFDTWLAGTAEDGFHEFNSPTYTPVTLFGMETAWTMTDDEVFRARLQRTMDLITYQMALNLSPNGFLGGAAARAYQQDALTGMGGAAFYSHIKFGSPCPPLGPTASVSYAEQTFFDYVPPEPVRRLALGKTAPIEIHDRGVSLASRRAHAIGPAFSLASQCIERVGGHSPPSYILLVRDSRAPRPSVPFLPDESFTHQPCASFWSRQEGFRVVGRLHYPLAEEQRAKFIEDPAFFCEPHVLFGLRDQIKAVRIGNVDWGGGDVRLQPGQSVAVSYGDLFLGVVALPLDRAGQPAPGRALLAYGEDGELRLHIRIHGGIDVGPEDDPVDALLFVTVRVPGEGQSLLAFADELSQWRLAQSVEGEQVTFTATCSDGTSISYPYTAADPDPLGDALHISPELTMRPGDLVALVNGAKPLPFSG
ncbi:MAG: hypothetical protein GXY76_11975 [Chloroflexi bacterium]|nr:hypothetical protein [Chloroflexota bacterium]